MAKKIIRGNNQKKQLGKGINALLASMDSTTTKQEVVKELSSTVAMIPISSVEVNPFQPRKEFDTAALEELERHRFN